MGFKRALVRLQKGTFWKSIRRLLEAKRACLEFKSFENSLQKLKNGNKWYCLKESVSLYSNPIYAFNRRTIPIIQNAK